MDNKGKRHKPSDLGLGPKDPSKYFNRSRTKTRIDSLLGMNVDVVNGEGELQARWKIIKEAREDPHLKEDRETYFVASGIRGVPFGGPTFDLEMMFFDLWPGDSDEQIMIINERIMEANKNMGQTLLYPRRKRLCTKVEFKTFIAIIIAATCYHKGGLCLWETKSKGIFMPPRFGCFMSHKRFKELWQYIPYAMSDPDQKTETSWWHINSFMREFVANRSRVVAAAHWKVLDELMSPFHPRTLKTGNLPHISYLIQKPQPLGTEFKCAACTVTGCMLALECQEGKECMKTVSFVFFRFS